MIRPWSKPSLLPFARLVLRAEQRTRLRPEGNDLASRENMKANEILQYQASLGPGKGRENPNIMALKENQNGNRT